MSRKPPDKDYGLDALLDLDGVSFFIDNDKSYWVKFVAQKVEPTPEKPHGIDYALTLHNPSGKRIFGYDNAHGVKAGRAPGAKKTRSHDHVHRDDTVRPYKFQNVATLLEDFWTNVDEILVREGVKK